MKQAWFTALLLQLNPQNLSKNECCRRFGMVYLLSIAEQGLLGELIHRKYANCKFVLAVCFSSHHTGSLRHTSRCILLVSAFLFHQEDHNGARKKIYFIYSSHEIHPFSEGKPFKLKLWFKKECMSKAKCLSLKPRYQPL